ncbi:MAG: AbrB/MazE/SpoVT family DNA-binding domain-containing protein [Chloroflexi bacterium]|nr:AbrB/MazE/SpoVT family DNA-binding domain-containing protein [Chloroflexota bacterium]
MADATVTSKGQITIPKPVRERMGLKPGDHVEFVEDHGKVHMKKKVSASPFKKFRGYLKHLKGMDPDKVLQDMRGQ